MAVKTYQPGNAIVLREQFLDRKYNPPQPVDPDTAIIDLWDPNDVQKVTAQPLTRVITGVWEYTYQSVDADAIGEWTQKITVTRGGYTNKKLSPSFILSVDPVA